VTTRCGLVRRRRRDPRPRAAGSVASALEAASSGPYDLLVSDVGLPEGSGVDLMRRLHPLPGIALTGYGIESDVAKSREARLLAHLTKSVDPGRLAEPIRQVAGGGERPELSAHRRSQQPPVPARAGFGRR
jgi:CheY-like chemotaxis protein